MAFNVWLLDVLAYRRREDSTQDDRGSLVTTPTAELSTQEESLLDSFLDWSLDSCSGYEGDRESEGKRDGDGKAYLKKKKRTQSAFLSLCKTPSEIPGSLNFQEKSRWGNSSPQ